MTQQVPPGIDPPPSPTGMYLASDGNYYPVPSGPQPQRPRWGVAFVALGLVAVASVVFVWASRHSEEAEASKEARVACGFLKEASSDDPDKTATFVRFMLTEGARHAARAEELDPARYRGFGDGMAGLAARAGNVDALDAVAVTDVCWK